MAELDKKKSYSIDMRQTTKDDLVKFSRQLRLPQGDALAYLIKEFDRTQDKLIDAANNKELMSTIISQQNSMIKVLHEQNALLQRLILAGGFGQND